MNIDDRIEALTMNLELAFRDIEALRTKIDQTTQNIDRLVGVVKPWRTSPKATSAE